MANRKQPYNWGRVKPGDIISFRYKPNSGNPPKTQTILVLNPRLNVTLKDGKSVKHLIGIKLEESNKISLRLNKRQVDILEQVGDFKKIDDKNNLFKGLNIQGQYRTYDYSVAKTSSVYLEPIRVVSR